MDYYDSLREELMVKREGIRALTRQSKIQGDYYEALIRDFIRKFIPQGYEVGYGIIFDEKKQTSKECDAIIYNVRERSPLFRSQNLVIVDARSVKIVVQVKSVLTSGTLQSAIENLKSVKRLNKQILCWIVGFETNRLLRTLYLNAWRSKVIQFLHVFKSSCITENETLLKSQMIFFVDLLRHHTEPGVMNPIDLVIYNDGRAPMFALPLNAEEVSIKAILSDVYREGFWRLWDKRYNPYKR